jgi:hypothetical protein
VQHGDIDYYLVLNDERGQKAAMSIEYGRSADDPEDPHPHPGTDGLHILHKAAGIPLKRTSPRSKRRKSYYSKKRRK